MEGTSLILSIARDSAWHLAELNIYRIYKYIVSDNIMIYGNLKIIHAIWAFQQFLLQEQVTFGLRPPTLPKISICLYISTSIYQLDREI